MADKLKKVRTKLVERCNKALLGLLLDDLLQKQILNQAEVEFIKEESPLRADKCRELVDMVIKKGDYSCNVLLQKIIERDEVLSKDLGITELPLPTQEQNNAQPIQREINGITMCSEAEFREITTTEKDRYPIREKCKRKRLALIICNVNFENLKERKGANFDLEGMRILLEGLDYEVQWKINLTAKEMQTTMMNFAKHDHKDSDSTFLVFMSHGERDIICGTDFKKETVEGKETATGALRVDSIFKTFNNQNCSGLRDKPKIIIIQACRGDDRSQVLVSDSAEELPNSGQEHLEDDAVHKMLKELDFICFYSTTPDTVSYRDPGSGSLFIQCLINCMKKDAHNLSLEDIFRNVQLSFKNNLQMPTQDRKTLLKTFFLLPGDLLHQRIYNGGQCSKHHKQYRMYQDEK
ncbi:caspase-1-B-like isoform X2 [Rhinoderma darwinii]|uniref:caspase-1-B-like isoform X2 n=1 Tax=Rhinoderma darwinii TaxID=43563 RepID=UPI003F679826